MGLFPFFPFGYKRYSPYYTYYNMRQNNVDHSHCANSNSFISSVPAKSTFDNTLDSNNNFNCNQNENNNINAYNKNNISNTSTNNYNHSQNYKKSSKYNRFANINFDSLLSSDLEHPIIEILGIQLYLDDLIILGLLFFLYKEDVHDEILFGILLLLLLS